MDLLLLLGRAQRVVAGECCSDRSSKQNFSWRGKMRVDGCCSEIEKRLCNMTGGTLTCQILPCELFAPPIHWNGGSEGRRLSG